MGAIYRITNLKNKQSTTYVGSTRQVNRRWYQHRWLLRHSEHPNPHLQASWDKYGESAFEFVVLEELPDDGLVEREQHWLDKYRAAGQVYNMGVVAESPAAGRKSLYAGVPRTTEVRRKISLSSKGHIKSEEHRQHISQALTGRRLSPEHRRLVSEGLMGHKVTPETCQRISVARGKLYPEFHNERTGEVIPAGTNLSAMCRKHGLGQSRMSAVKNGRRRSYKGWVTKVYVSE